MRNTEEATKPREWLTLGKVADHYWENIEGKKTARKEAVAKKPLPKGGSYGSGDRVVKL